MVTYDTSSFKMKLLIIGWTWTKNPVTFDQWSVECVFKITGRGRIGADGLVGLLYSSPPLLYGHTFCSKGGLSVDTIQQYFNTVLPLLSGRHPFCNKSGLLREVATLEGHNLVVFCYLFASEIWPDKRGWPLFSGTIQQYCQSCFNDHLY